MIKYYYFVFEDNYIACVRGFSQQELSVEIQKHGKLITKQRAC